MKCFFDAFIIDENGDCFYFLNIVRTLGFIMGGVGWKIFVSIIQTQDRRVFCFFTGYGQRGSEAKCADYGGSAGSFLLLDDSEFD